MQKQISQLVLKRLEDKEDKFFLELLHGLNMIITDTDLSIDIAPEIRSIFFLNSVISEALIDVNEWQNKVNKKASDATDAQNVEPLKS